MTESDYLRYRKELFGSSNFKTGNRRIDFRHKPPSLEAAAAMKSQVELAKQRRTQRKSKNDNANHAIS